MNVEQIEQHLEKIEKLLQAVRLEMSCPFHDYLEAALFEMSQTVKQYVAQLKESA